MINIKKGTAHSLQQSDKTYTPLSTDTIVAGQVMLHVTATPGTVQKSDNTAGNVVGFAINNSTDGDVIDSGKIGVYNLDGNSVIETDQVVDAITAANFPVGGPVYAYIASNTAGSRGKVTATSTNNKFIGTVEGIRTLPAVEPSTQSTSSYQYSDRNGTTQTIATVKHGWGSTTVLGIKLASFPLTAANV